MAWWKAIALHDDSQLWKEEWLYEQMFTAVSHQQFVLKTYSEVAKGRFSVDVFILLSDMNMEFFQFCLEIISREGQKFNVAFNAPGLKKITTATNSDYNLPVKRCHFLYKCGTIKLYFAKVCFNTFLLDHKITKSLLSKWNNCADLTYCSISTGPALDYMALLYSFQESGLIPPLFKNVKIVSKYGAWKSSTKIMNEIICEGSLKSLPDMAFGKIKVVEGNPFKDFTQKVRCSINSSDVIVMMQTSNLHAGLKQKKIKSSIQVFLNALKPGAILFCIDTDPSIKVITRLLNLIPGTFLLKPMFLKTVINLDCPSVIREHVGCLPVSSAEGSFFVWEKSSVSICNLENELNGFSESFKSKLNLNHVSEKECDNNEVADRCGIQYSAPPKSSSAGQSTVKSSFDLQNKDHQFANSAKNCPEYSNCFLPSSSSQNVSVNIKKENKTNNVSSSVCGLVTACIQTEPEDILQETETKKIIDLTHRIENLTAELTEILIEKNESKCCEDDYSIKRLKDTCKPLVVADGSCSSANSCPKFSDGIPNCGISNTVSQCCCCDNTETKRMSCGFEASSLSNHNAIISAENNSLSSAQLVIPLTNLSADVVSQIVLLLCESNKKNINKVNDQTSS